LQHGALGAAELAAALGEVGEVATQELLGEISGNARPRCVYLRLFWLAPLQ
jgi:hypothetical protein